MTITKDQVLTALAQLGGTPDEVAHTLERMGIRGARASFSRDPIVGYLKRKLDKAEHFETSEMWVWWGACGKAEEVDTPEPVRQFMHAFDHLGHYGHLVDPKAETAQLAEDRENTPEGEDTADLFAAP